jgi:Na+/glutamate symporter
MKLLPDELVFASDAEMAAIVGAGFLILAGITNLAERRRVRRERIDRVGWVPWTGLFLVCAVIGLTLVGLGALGLLKG